ncbi:putative protein kinase RLK-Pelle-L-LEC family [Helianthus annuus]|nr:putative protein kinase RLK-Pelle-L-LEC family [Helianthus annuus]
MGYLLPNYLQYGKATDETDIFSYGVVVLELCCGKRPIEREHRGHKMNNLVAWVWELQSKSAICDVVDKRLNKEFDPNVRLESFCLYFILRGLYTCSTTSISILLVSL